MTEHLKLLRHPRTGELIRPIGYGRRGPIWPVLGGDGTDPVPPAPPAPPTPPPAPPAPTPPPAPPAPAPAPPAPSPTVKVNEWGYPDGTRVEDMSVEHQAAYWRVFARRNEDRLKETKNQLAELQKVKEQHDKLVEANQTETEKAITKARAEGAAEATRAVGSKLVAAEVRAASAGRMERERVDALLEHLDRSKFLDSNGDVDTAKVAAYVDAVAPPPPAQPAQPAPAPAPTVVPGTPPAPVPAPVAAPTPGVPVGTDFGQGSPPNPRPSGLEAGRQLARERLARQQNGGRLPVTAANPTA